MATIEKYAFQQWPLRTYRIWITDTLVFECTGRIPEEEHRKNMEQAFGWRFEEIKAFKEKK